MLRFALLRILSAIPTLIFVVALAFMLVRAAPGGPFDDERALPPEIEANIQSAYHLDEPLPAQFMRYFKGLLRGWRTSCSAGCWQSRTGRGISTSKKAFSMRAGCHVWSLIRCIHCLSKWSRIPISGIQWLRCCLIIQAPCVVGQSRWQPHALIFWPGRWSAAA